MAIVNNVTRLLDSHKISYFAYELPAEKLGAMETAGLLGVDESIVFKTIVVIRENSKKPILVVIPGNRVVDLKLVASTFGEKKVTLPSEHEAETITGLQAGGISPLALINKRFTVVIDVVAQNFAEIHISGGQRGLNIKLGVSDLAKLTTAKFAPISTQIPGSRK
jgi:Cys-tRNA(Pro)/Cys-tRNA(Cys) deacylase